MSILTGPEILRQMSLKRIVIDPFVGEVNPNSVNLRLGPKLFRYTSPHAPDSVEDEAGLVLSPWEDNPVIEVPPFEYAKVPPERSRQWVLHPGVLYLGSTLEYTETWGFAPMLEGRSSVGRLGISVHATAGVGDQGFCGNWTLELTVTHPAVVYPGMPICQILYHTLEGERLDYDGRYQGDRQPAASRLWQG